MGRAGVLASLLVAAVGCADEGEVLYLARSSCEACHRPVAPDGTPRGIERAHPDVDGQPLTCERCHGGDPAARKQSEAHVAPDLLGYGGLRTLSPRQLDEVDPAYLRFINPGDLRVAGDSCGGAGCHDALVERVRLSPMATAAGEIDVTRYRAAMQPDSAGGLGIYDALDDDFAGGTSPPDAVESLTAFAAAPVAAGEQAVGPYLDLVLDRDCLRCHLWSYGRGFYDGEHRSSGCSACHVPYAPDGLSLSGDPMIDKGEPGRPERHVLTTAIPTGQCASCHNEPSFLAQAFQGRLRRGAGDPPAGAAPLGEALFGLPPGGLLVDPEAAPADAHFEAGMHCVDCHVGADVHGDGWIRTDGAAAVTVRCEHCHAGAEPPPGLALGRDEAGAVTLVTRLGQATLRPPQIVPGAGIGHDDAHLARMRCDTCHSAWQARCTGCHLTVDLSLLAPSQVGHEVGPGRVSRARGEVALTGPVLMLDHAGRIAIGAPAERPALTAIDGQGETVFEDRIRRGPEGEPGLGLRAIAPHTTRRTGPFGACTACHPEPAGDDSSARAAAGLLEPAVVVGHGASAPLPADIVQRMLSVDLTAR